jgi:hypothetical protein
MREKSFAKLLPGSARPGTTEAIQSLRGNDGQSECTAAKRPHGPDPGGQHAPGADCAPVVACGRLPVPSSCSKSARPSGHRHAPIQDGDPGTRMLLAPSFRVPAGVPTKESSRILGEQVLHERAERSPAAAGARERRLEGHRSVGMRPPRHRSHRLNARESLGSLGFSESDLPRDSSCIREGVETAAERRNEVKKKHRTWKALRTLTSSVSYRQARHDAEVRAESAKRVPRP